MREELESTIDHLRQQLESADSMDDAELQELRNALEELTSTLDHQDVNSAGLAQTLHEKTEAFEESHPILVQTIGRIADMLSQMGI